MHLASHLGCGFGAALALTSDCAIRPLPPFLVFQKPHDGAARRETDPLACWEEGWPGARSGLRLIGGKADPRNCQLKDDSLGDFVAMRETGRWETPFEAR